MNYYNENDPYAAQWLRNLIDAGHIAKGEVDERSIVDVEPGDLSGYTQCHFFAGIGIWSYALRLAGWPDDRFVWTGSCPCQPFSGAGKGDEFADERHLWPVWFRLIEKQRPDAIFGEQVASKDALAWLDHVSFDLETAGYTFGAVDTCAAGFGAPHIRQRLYFVADNDSMGRRGWRAGEAVSESGPLERPERRSDAGELGDSQSRGRRERGHETQQGSGGHADGAEQLEFMGHPNSQRLERIGADDSAQGWQNQGRQTGLPDGAMGANGFWSDAEWISCRDGKARPTEPGTFPLVNGASQRVGRLRAYGNAIVAPQAAEFIRAYREIT